MPMIIDAIYENGVLRPLGSLDLAEHQQVRVIVEIAAPKQAAPHPASDEDPLAGVRIATSLGDLAEDFDGYRFGQCCPENIEQIIERLRAISQHGCIEYAGEHDFRHTVLKHFTCGRAVYGVYVVRAAKSNEVIYVGKAGTIGREGRFKEQDIPTRLTNRQGKNMSRKEWFQGLVKHHGRLKIEYLELPAKLSPAFVEAYLLQAYFNDHRRLPEQNGSL